MIAIVLALQAAAVPSTRSIDLGIRLARQGTIATLLPLIAAHPELDDVDRAKLRRTAAETRDRGTARLMASIGRDYARRLTIAEMRRLIAFNDGPVARRYRAVLPQVIAGTLASVGTIDFKSDTLTAFCRRTGKLCVGK